jgi:type VI secretion system protein VasD
MKILGTGIRGHSRPAFAAAFALALLAVSCGKKAPPPPPVKPPDPPVTIAAAPEAKVKASMTIAANGEINPDANGRPSPVVIRVYQLKADAAFSKSDFTPLYDDDQKALGPELITRDEFVLAPSESRTLDVTLSPDTRFIGAIAAFRDIRNAQWRALLPAPRTGMTIGVERARVVLSAAK